MIALPSSAVTVSAEITPPDALIVNGCSGPTVVLANAGDAVTVAGFGFGVVVVVVVVVGGVDVLPEPVSDGSVADGSVADGSVLPGSTTVIEGSGEPGVLFVGAETVLPATGTDDEVPLDVRVVPPHAATPVASTTAVTPATMRLILIDTLP